MIKYCLRSITITLKLTTLLIPILFFGCSKDRLGSKVIVEGIVYEDCDGNTSANAEVILQYKLNGGYGTSVISEEKIRTDSDGYYKFKYREALQDGSSVHYYHQLLLPNSSIVQYDPAGNFDIYPNDTTMHATIHLKFRNEYTSNDTFYYQFRPSPEGVREEAENIQYFVGPFQDTTLLLNNLRIGNTNSTDKGEGHCGSFKWGLGIKNLDRYYTGRDGFFYFTHEPCADVDSFEYTADPKHR